MTDSNEILDSFYKYYFNWMKEDYLEFNSKEYGITEENYWGKVSEPTNLSNNSFVDLESNCGYSLPQVFKDFYIRCYTFEKDYDLGGIFIAGNRKGDNLETLAEYFFKHGLSEDIVKLGLLPFGLYNDEWYICLDMRENVLNPPISLFEMSSWESGENAISHKYWFSNFEKFIECMASAIPDSYKQIDPGSNYTSAYSYW